MYVLKHRGYLYGKGMPELGGSLDCSVCKSKKVKVIENVKPGVTLWECKECGHKFRYDRNRMNARIDPYVSAGMTRGIQRRIP